MLRGFARANENHWNVQTVAFFENCVLFDIHFAQRSGEFCAGAAPTAVFSFLAKMATRPRVKGDLTRASSGQARVLRVFFHGFGLEYFLNGPA